MEDPELHNLGEKGGPKHVPLPRFVTGREAPPSSRPQPFEKGCKVWPCCWKGALWPWHRHGRA